MKVDFEVWLLKVYNLKYDDFLKNHSKAKDYYYSRYISYLKN